MTTKVIAKFAAAGIALGCIVIGIARGDSPAATRLNTDTRLPTFNKDVAPIVFNNCATCHHAGEVAPFPLMSYADVRKHAKEIVELTQDRQMPPWKASHEYGHFVGERRLTDEQIATIAAWSRGGKPQGNPADLPPTPTFASGWSHGTPDIIVKMPQPFALQAEGRDVFRVFVIPLNLSEDIYVSAVDFRPGNPKIVHHALFFLDNTGQARELEKQAAEKEGANHQPGYERTGGPGFLPTGSLGGWSPGYRPEFLADGIGRHVRKGSDLVVQVHFHPSGKIEQEQSTFGIYLTKRTPDKILLSTIHGAKIDIPAGEKNYETNGEFVVPFNVEVAGVIPHAHLLCKEIQVHATLPNGSDLPLIWIKDWDWNWQEQYQYANTIKIPAGTVIHMRFRYDNSAENPKNPSSPPRHVRFGEQTSDEMALVFFQILLDRKTAEADQDLRGLVRRLIQDRPRPPREDGTENKSNQPDATKKRDSAK